MFYLSKLIKKLHLKAIKHSKIHSTSKIEAGSEVYYSSFGKHSFCGYHCKILHCDIGSFCSIADYVSIGLAMHPYKWISTSPAFYEGRDSIRAKFSKHPREAPQRVNIGHDVWIGEQVLIKQGITIGTGSVIGMGSVVTKDIEPFSIAVGVPARKIKKRFNDQICERLLASQWWELDEDILSQKAAQARDPEAFLKELGL